MLRVYTRPPTIPDGPSESDLAGALTTREADRRILHFLTGTAEGRAFCLQPRTLGWPWVSNPGWEDDIASRNTAQCIRLRARAKADVWLLGGDVGHDAELQQQLNEAYDAGRLDSATSVNLVVDPDPRIRTSAVRDALRAVAHGSPTEAAAAAVMLAGRLGAALDNRSKPCLLVVSKHATSRAAEPRVVLWTFPRQSVFSLGTRGRGARIHVNEAFVRESYLRKAAVFVGGTGRTDFLSGRVLDKQALGTDRAVADLWISKFLDARLQMSSTEGTRLLARALRHAHDHFRDDANAQSEIHAAILGVRASRAAHVSIDGIASQFLSPAVGTVLRSVGRNDDAASAAFALDKQLFDEQVQFRIYRLDNGVWVSAPFDQLGDGITRDGRRLTATGLVEEEQIRARHR